MPINPRHMVQCLRIEPKTGDPIRLALSYPVNLRMQSGEIYLGGIYSQPSAISSTINGAPTVIDIGSVYDVDTITRDQIQSGYWDGAKVYSFFTQWSIPYQDEMPDRLYTLGKVREQDDRFVVEMMSHLDLMNQSSGDIITPGCRYVLGDAHVDGTIIASDKSRCKVNPLLVSNTPSFVTSVISPTEFYGDGLGGFPDDFFGNGEIIFKTGQNAGLPFKFVRTSNSAGLIVLAQSFYYPILDGDEFDIKVGCRKRFQEDCINKFINGDHFGGFPHVPQKSSVIKFGDQ